MFKEGLLNLVNSKTFNVELIEELREKFFGELEDCLKKAEAKIQAHPADIDEACKILQKTLDMLQLQVTDLTCSNFSLNQKIMECEQLLKESLKEKDSLEIQLEFKERRILQLQVDCNSAPKAIQKVEDTQQKVVENIPEEQKIDLAVLNAELTELRSLVNQKDEQISLLSKAKIDLESEMNRVKMENDEDKKQVESLSQDYRSGRRNDENTPDAVVIRALKDTLRDGEVQISRLLKEKNDLFRSEAINIVEKLKSMLEQHQKTSESEHLENELFNLRSERDLWQKKLDESSAKLNYLNEMKGQLERTVNSMKDRIVGLQSENSRLRNNYDQALKINSSVGDEKIQEMNALIAQVKQDEESLMGEIESISSAFEELQNQNSSLLKLVADKEVVVNNLLSDRIKSENQMAVLIKEKDQLQHKTMSIKKLEVQLKADSSKLSSSLQESMAKLMEAEKELALRLHQSDIHKRKANENSALLAESNQKIEKLNAKMQEFMKQSTEKLLNMTEVMNENKKLTEKNRILNKKLEIYQQSGNQGIDMMSKELDVMRKLMRCNSCHVRQKSVALQRCMHIFCKECIDTRLETRQRKCPNCGDPFGANDVRPFYL